MMNIFRRLFNKWNVVDKCPKCGCIEFKTTAIDTINGQVCEEETRCKNCSNLLDYWAYGYSCAINHRTDQLKHIWKSCISGIKNYPNKNIPFSTKKRNPIGAFNNSLKQIVNGLKQSFHYIFKKDILFIG